MSATRRAWLFGFLIVLGSVAAYGKTVTRWDSPAIFNALGIAAMTAVGVMSKSPHDAAAEDRKV